MSVKRATYHTRNTCGVCYGYLIPDGQTTPCEHCIASGRPLVSASRRDLPVPSDAEGAILAEQEEQGWNP